MREQILRHLGQLRAPRREDLLAARIGAVDDGLDLVVDLRGGLFRVAARLAHRLADEHLVVAALKGDGAEAVAHAVGRDHAARDVRGALDVVRRAGGNVAEHQLLRRAPAEERDDLLLHVALGLIGAVLVRQRDGHAARASARDDGDAVDRLVRGQRVHHDGVPRLVIGGQLPLVLGHDAAALFGAGEDLDLRLLEVRHGDELVAAARAQQRRLVGKIFEIRAGEARRALRDLGEVHVLGERLVGGVDLQNVLAPLDVGIADVDLAVEAAGAQQRGIENVRAVGRRENDHALVRAEAVHLHKELVERLLALVVAAAEAGAALTADRVDLVDENDAGSGLLGLLKEVAHAARADADVHLHKVRAGDGEELHARLARDRAGEQRLARARRSDEQHALGDARADIDEALRIAQEVHDLAQFLLLLVRAGDVGKGGLAGALAAVLEGRVAELRHAVVPAAGGAHGEKVPDGEKPRDGDHIGQRDGKVIGRVVGGVVVVRDDPRLVLLLDERVEVVVEQVEVVKLLLELRLAVHRLAQRERERGVLHGEGLHLLLLEELHDLGVADLRLLGSEEERAGREQHEKA